jgi:hypothetical protein
MGNGLVRVADEEPQNIVFFGTQVLTLPGESGAPNGEIDFEITTRESFRLGIRLRPAAHSRANSRKQLRDATWLSDVVVGSRVECLHLVALAGGSGKHDDGNIRGCANGSVGFQAPSAGNIQSTGTRLCLSQ